MSGRFAFFCVPATTDGRRAVGELSAADRPLNQNLRFVLFDEVGEELWAAAPREKPLGCLIEVVPGEDDPPGLEAAELAAERLDAHGVSVFLLTTSSSVPAEWLRRPLFSNYHLLQLCPSGGPDALRECEETIVGHLHFARFATDRDVQVYEPSAVKFLRSRQRLEQECFVMSSAERSAARAKCFVKLLARHTCADFHAIEIERFDCTFDALLDVEGVDFSPDLPCYLIDGALEALQYLHDWSDLGIRTLGHFRAEVGLPLRQAIPSSIYFRHFRHLAAETFDELPFQIIHCDLKPSNFLVRITDPARQKLKSGQGAIAPEDLPEVKLFDFDLCRYAQPDPGSSGSENGPTFMGTCGYTAPELFLVDGLVDDIDVREERQITPLVDFYAIGTILFELLTRQMLLPRELLKLEDVDYYSSVLAFQNSADFAARLDLVPDPSSRALISACTQPRQADRESSLRELLDIEDTGGPVTAATLRGALRDGASPDA